MKVEYIFIGIIALIGIYICLLFLKSNKKIKASQKAKTVEKEKTDDKKSDTTANAKSGKVEVKSEVIKESPIEKAIKEANEQNKINESFQKLAPQSNIEVEKSKQGNRLELDRSEFRTELEKNSPRHTISSETNILKSEKQEIGTEGPDKQQIDEVDIAIAKERETELQNEAKANKSMANEVKNLSPEMKAVLLNDILNRKY